MRVELRTLGPVFLVLLAGYLATSLSDYDFSFGLSSLTGRVITDQSGAQACPPDQILFRVSGPGNAHAALAGQTQYTYAVCWDGRPTTPAQRQQCADNSTNLVLRLSDSSNAHVEKKQLTTYQQRVCFGTLQCNTQPQGQCSTLGPTWRCAASLSAETNAHVADCGIYPVDLCCSDGSTSGGGPYRPDNDTDGVFDIGVGPLLHFPCNPRVAAHAANNFSLCADNCRTIPNADQLDADEDGAGDVCDQFVNDSCSIQALNDNCPHLQQCRNLVASWSSTSALEGESVGLTVTGSSECSDKIAHFQVFDRDYNTLLLTSPQPATFGNGTSSTTTASSIWITEYFLNGTNRYYFQVTVTGGNTQVQATSSQNALLTVQPRPFPQCGNGIVEGSAGERCDDNNTVSGDGCSSTCRREGNFTGGQSCEHHPLCVGIPATYMVCQTNSPTNAYFCLTGSNGCKVLSNPLSCSNANGVQTVCVRGADTCKSPTCTFQYSTSSCNANGEQTIRCSATGGNHCACGSGYPRTVSCATPHEEEAFPVFTLSNFLLTIVLLVLFYTFRRGVSWKSR